MAKRGFPMHVPVKREYFTRPFELAPPQAVPLCTEEVKVCYEVCVVCGKTQDEKLTQTPFLYVLEQVTHPLNLSHIATIELQDLASEPSALLDLQRIGSCESS